MSLVFFFSCRLLTFLNLTRSRTKVIFCFVLDIYTLLLLLLTEIVTVAIQRICYYDSNRFANGPHQFEPSFWLNFYTGYDSRLTNIGFCINFPCSGWKLPNEYRYVWALIHLGLCCVSYNGNWHVIYKIHAKKRKSFDITGFVGHFDSVPIWMWGEEKRKANRDKRMIK